MREISTQKTAHLSTRPRVRVMQIYAHAERNEMSALLGPAVTCMMTNPSGLCMRWKSDARSVFVVLCRFGTDRQEEPAWW